MKITKRHLRRILREALDEKNLQVYHSLKDAASKYTEVEKLFVAGWGSLLYLNIDQYKSIPDSQLASMDHVYDVAKEYAEAHSSNDRDAMLDLDEWIEEGGPMKDGLYLFNYNRMDRILRNAAEKTKLKEPLTIIRAERTSRSLEDIGKEWNSWSAGTKSGSVFGGKGDQSFTVDLPVGTPVIYGHGLADPEEIIFKGQIPRQTT